MAKNGKESAKNGAGYAFGTFKGVFTPSILTILGVIMYLRFGWVLGNLGLPLTLLLVTLCTGITFLTGLALSSLATNMQVGGGGAYFIISRSLGLEAGAAVGLPLFFAQALGISFYIAGFAESVNAMLPSLSPQVVGCGTLIVLAIIAYKSADLALKLQFFIMAAIALSLVSLFLGDVVEPSQAVASQPLRFGFWAVFAVFFPAVTGIEAGIALSGDLKDPAKSLPRGTLMAVVVGYLVYLAIPIFLHSLNLPDDVLISDPLIMRRVALWGDTILVGLWGASLSSALGAILGAPRTLQALAQDGVVPRIIGKSFGERGDPHFAALIAFGIGLVGILLGDLNLIAPVLSMFFLTSYGVLNLSAGLEEFIASPSWRPKFKVPWKINLLAAFGCFAAMLMINAGAALVSLGVSASVYTVMQRRSFVARWGDVRTGMVMTFVQSALKHLVGTRIDARTWKPNILVLSGAPTSRWYLIALASAISSGRSLMTVATVLPEEEVSSERAAQTEKAIEEHLRKKDVEAFVKVLRASSVSKGLEDLVRIYGFGPLTPNTILLGETEQHDSILPYVNLVALVCRRKRNLVIVREGSEEFTELATGSRIDVWWGRKSQNVGFMLSLAYQLKRSQGWQQADLVLKTLVTGSIEDEESKVVEQQLKEFILRARLDARVELVERHSSSPFDDIRQSSAEASLVFLGLRPPRDDEEIEEYARYYQDLLVHTDGFPPTAIAYAAEDLDFRAIFA